jgi:regulator of sirC expression with transglutaminase-like and TPR domain
MFSKLKKEIQPKPKYNKKEALKILNTIGAILKEYGHFEYKSNRLLIEELNKEKNGIKFLDCDDYSSIYLAAAEQLGLPLKPVYFPAHVFLRCELISSRNFYWEPTIAAETNINYYKKRMNIPENSGY